jgi:hypothetical protein
MNPLELPELDRLEMLEVFAYYDGPRLFSCRDANGQLYLAVSVEEDGPTHTYLYVAVSAECYEALDSGRIDLRTAFAEPEDGTALKITTFRDDAPSAVERLAAGEVPPEWLPDPGEYLDPAS